MPFERPTLPTLIARFKADLRAYTDGGDALLRRSVERVLSKVVPGLTHGLYGHLAWVARQLLPDTCEPEGVLRWAAILGITLRPAAAAIGRARFETTGPLIPIGHLVRRADGVRYFVTAATALVGEVEVELEAEVPGAAANADMGTPLTLVSPVAGVNSAGVVTDPDGLHDGVDVEDVDVSLRERVLQRLKNPPRGGGRGDYVAWALEVPGVTRAWETPRVLGAGTVGVQFVTDDALTGTIPTPGKVDEVEAYLVERAPVTIGRAIDGQWVGVIVSAPTAHPINPSILVTPDTPEVRLAVTAELEDFLRREAAPGKRIALSRFREAISSAAGEHEHALLSPTTDIVPAPGHLPVLGTPTWP